MSYPQRIYIDYDDYDELYQYGDISEFFNDVENALEDEDTYQFNWLSDTSSVKAKIKLLIKALTEPIYNEYSQDKIAYRDYQYFIKRLINTMIWSINKWYMRFNIDDDLMSNASLQNFTSKGHTKSVTDEEAQTGSAVMQKSASTPTGIEHGASEESMSMNLVKDESTGETTMTFDDNYDEKYTNFVGKTNGVHKNNVLRETDIDRSSDFGLAMDILEKIPYSYINDVLSDVSEHFIQIY